MVKGIGFAYLEQTLSLSEQKVTYSLPLVESMKAYKIHGSFYLWSVLKTQCPVYKELRTSA